MYEATCLPSQSKKSLESHRSCFNYEFSLSAWNKVLLVRCKQFCQLLWTFKICTNQGEPRVWVGFVQLRESRPREAARRALTPPKVLSLRPVPNRCSSKLGWPCGRGEHRVTRKAAISGPRAGREPAPAPPFQGVGGGFQRGSAAGDANPGSAAGRQRGRRLPGRCLGRWSGAGGYPTRGRREAAIAEVAGVRRSREGEGRRAAPHRRKGARRARPAPAPASGTAAVTDGRGGPGQAGRAAAADEARPLQHRPRPQSGRTIAPGPRVPSAPPLRSAVPKPHGGARAAGAPRPALRDTAAAAAPTATRRPGSGGAVVPRRFRHVLRAGQVRGARGAGPGRHGRYLSPVAAFVPGRARLLEPSRGRGEPGYGGVRAAAAVTGCNGPSGP